MLFNSKSRIHHSCFLPHASTRNGYVVLVGVLIMGAVAFSVANSVLLLGLGSSRSSFAEQQSYQSQTLGDACAEIAVKKLKDDSAYTGNETISLGSAQCVISTITEAGGVKTINVEGTAGTAKKRSQVLVTVSTSSGTQEQSYFENVSFTTQNSSNNVTGKDRYPNTSNAIAMTFVTGANNSGTCAPAPTVTPVITIGGTTMDSGNVQDVTVSPGDTMKFHGENFQAGLAGGLTDPKIFINGSQIGTCTLGVGATSFNNCSQTAPTIVAGTYDATASNTAVTCTVTTRAQKVTIVPKISITGTSCGTNSIALSGNGFGASKTITIIWDNTDTITTTTSSGTGTFSGLSFTLPATGSTHKIRAKDNSATPNFTPVALTNPC